MSKSSRKEVLVIALQDPSKMEEEAKKYEEDMEDDEMEDMDEMPEDECECPKCGHTGEMKDFMKEGE